MRQKRVSGAAADTIFAAPELAEVLESCLSCKGCVGECPSGVDMTRLKSELLQQKYDRHRLPLRSWAFARMSLFEGFGSWVRPLYNYFASAKWSSALLKRILKFAPARNIPTLSQITMRKLVRQDGRRTCEHGGALSRSRQVIRAADDAGCEDGRSPLPQAASVRPQPKVYLFADEFTNYQEAELGLTFARLLRALGYEVEIPRHRESGRAAISKGDLRRARRLACVNVELLADIVSEDVPLVGIEPSCILSFRDEYPDLVPPELRDKARSLGRNCLLYDEFLAREIAAGRISADAFRRALVPLDESAGAAGCENGSSAPGAAVSGATGCKSGNSAPGMAVASSVPLQIWLHGHCHQKALVGIEKTASVLRTLLPDADLHVIPSGCCGMAGSFGYEREHYETSMAIGEMVLFPAVRKAMAQAASALGTRVASVPEAHKESAPGTLAGPAAMTPGTMASGAVTSADGMKPAGEGGRNAGRQRYTQFCHQSGLTVVLAPGTSCRQQILDGTGVQALHPVELLYRSLKA